MLYASRYARRHFHAVRLLRGSLATLPPGPLLVCSNHPSWWDPLIFAVLTGTVFDGRPGWGPMERASLGRYGVLRRLGAFGIDPDTRAGAQRFLEVGRDVLDRTDGMFWVTAQGRFTDIRTRPLLLQPGSAHLARRAGPGAVLPLALEYPFWNERAPEALLAFGAPLPFDPARSVADWQALLTERLTATMDGLATAVARRDVGQFTTLVAGRTGIGGVYDIWRRLCASWRGEKITLAHGEPG